MTAKGPAAATAGRKTPSEFLQKILGGNVLVKLNTGTIYKGTLQCLDDRMNIALEKAQEFSQEQTLVASYPLALIRGNNGETHCIAELGCSSIRKASRLWAALRVLYISSEKDEEAE